MPTMSVHDQMMAVYRHQVPEQMPVSIYYRFLPRGWTERMIRNVGFGIIDYYPILTLLAPPWHTWPGYISEVKGVDFEIRYSWVDGEMEEIRTYRTPVGTAYQRTVTDPTYGADWINKFYIDSVEDYKIVQYIVEHTVFRKNEDRLQEKKEDLGGDGVVWGRIDRTAYQKLLWELAGPQRFLLDLMTTPEPVLELMDAIERKLDESFAMVLQSEVEVVWQPENITSDMAPPDAFKRYCLPHYEKRARLLKEAGKPYIIHMDGRLKALKELIAGSPFDVIESLSLPQIGGDLTLPEAHAAFPGKAITVNFPSNLSFEEDAAIEHAIREILTGVSPDLPFMLQLSEDIPHYEWKRVLP
ncbi:MAG: hypothetical protein IT330_05980 [Anaerolineae bacterium]|nr:hypothetical protein [Anaerolineae bacterium]